MSACAESEYAYFEDLGKGNSPQPAASLQLVAEMPSAFS